jgi:hypothetical protein
MGGTVTINGTAADEMEGLYASWQRALANKAAFFGSFAGDTVVTENNGQVLLTPVEHCIRPDQMVVTLAAPEVTRYVIATDGLLVRDAPKNGSKRGGLPYLSEIKVTPSETPGWVIVAASQYAKFVGGFVCADYLSATRP